MFALSSWRSSRDTFFFRERNRIRRREKEKEKEKEREREREGGGEDGITASAETAHSKARIASENIVELAIAMSTGHYLADQNHEPPPKSDTPLTSAKKVYPRGSCTSLFLLSVVCIRWQTSTTRQWAGNRQTYRRLQLSLISVTQLFLVAGHETCRRQSEMENKTRWEKRLHFAEKKNHSWPWCRRRCSEAHAARYLQF